MPEQIQAILNKILEWWKKFTKRQKILIISIASVVVISFIILGVVISQPKMVLLIDCEDATEASSVKTLLDDNAIEYETSQDGFSFYVEEKNEAEANILLGSNEIPTKGYSLEDVIDGSFSTTEADKEKRYQLYLESRFGEFIESLSMVDEAKVTLNLPDEDGTIISQSLPSYASIIVKLNAPMTDDIANSLAKYVATELGNDDTVNITIMDTDGNMLFSGGDDSTAAGNATANQDVRDRVKENIANEVKDVINKTEVYDNVEVGINLDMNFDENGFVDYHYYVDEGQTQGYLDSETGKNSSAKNGNGGVPGTDSNDDDTTYVTDDGNVTESSTEEFTKDYLPSETITTHNDEVGKINYDDSSISVACTAYAVYNQEQMEKDGTLKEMNMTFDEFVAANSDRVQMEVTDDFINLVANATGFSPSKITIVAYEIPMFQYKDKGPFSITDILQMVLAALIFAMLGFVVFRSLKSEEEEPVEEEVTLEDLIASTQKEEEEPLDDIGYTEKSEARLLIEKFVDEKPEAVAQLLRNWLNEDWG